MMIQKPTLKNYYDNIRNYLGYIVKYHGKTVADLTLSACGDPILIADYIAYKKCACNANSLSKLLASLQSVMRYLKCKNPQEG